MDNPYMVFLFISSYKPLIIICWALYLVASSVTTSIRPGEKTTNYHPVLLKHGTTIWTLAYVE